MADARNILYTTVKIGDIVQIGDGSVRIEEKSGRSVRLAIMSPHRVTVFKNPLAQECLNTTESTIHGTDHDHDQRRAN